ncbi:MAG: tRNA 2-thiouridine(34) synthase MnmA [Candidatus Paceibacterota bacterium]
MKKTANKTVFVGLSGGVDSGVAAALLQNQGFDVVGVFIRTWHPDFLECNEEEERRDAMRVAAHLDIPFLIFDLEDVYKREVADYMISEYKAGRTPNPDVMCNKEVKFGAFLKKSLKMGADFVATGHYAKVKNHKISFAFLHPAGGTFRGQKSYDSLLLKGKDVSKDQSYFLWTLRQEQLSKILFPVGHLKKTEVRTLAKKFKLPVAKKKDSQGICFLGAIDLKEFLKHYIKEKKSKVVNEKGKIIGWHMGAVFHTLGERHGFTVTKKSPNDGPYYVVAKDLKKNILIVSQNSTYSHSKVLTNIRIENTNWIFLQPKADKIYTAQVRYHGDFLPCTIICAKSNLAQVIFQRSVMVASGQSVVVYDKDVCLGGGVVK